MPRPRGPGFLDRRGRALLQLFANTPCRLAEVADRTVADLDLEEQLLTIVAKGRRPRDVPFDPDTLVAPRRISTHALVIGSRR